MSLHKFHIILYKVYLLLVQNLLKLLFVLNFYAEYFEENLYFYNIHC